MFLNPMTSNGKGWCGFYLQIIGKKSQNFLEIDVSQNKVYAFANNTSNGEHSLLWPK